MARPFSCPGRSARAGAPSIEQGAIFQGLLTGKPITENHALKQIPFETSILCQLQAPFPTISDVSIDSSGGVQVYVVIAMKPRYEGEARHAIRSASNSRRWPKSPAGGSSICLKSPSNSGLGLAS